jgi:hypothetical protein
MELNYRLSTSSKYLTDRSVRPVSPSKFILTTSIYDEGLVNDVEEWIKSSQWYYDRGIPYRRGKLFVLHPHPRLRDRASNF